jgi:MoaA/NifB/PqqE/SkfB family radical SAM enzyme
MGNARVKNDNVSNPFYAFGVLYKSDNFITWEENQTTEFKDYRNAWVDRVHDTDPGKFPLNLNVEATTRCNLECTFCSHKSLTDDQVGDIDIESFKKIIDEGEKEGGLPTININGLGEPLLRKDLHEFVKYAKEHGVQDVMFHTNATIMTEKIAKQLIESGLDRIVFSVDSPDKETYEAMRTLKSSYDKLKNVPDAIMKGTPWEKTVANVKKFVEVRNKMGLNKPIIRATMVVTDNTVHQVQDLMDLWKDVVDHITVQDLTWRTKLLENGEWENKETSSLPTNFDEIREEAIKRNVKFVCPYLYQSVYQFFGGAVIPCSNPNARTQMIMGEWDKQPMAEIWHGEEYKKIRSLHENGEWHKHPVCRDCEVALIELYKDMVKQNVQFSGNKSNDKALVGEDMQQELLES